MRAVPTTVAPITRPVADTLVRVIAVGVPTSRPRFCRKSRSCAALSSRVHSQLVCPQELSFATSSPGDATLRRYGSAFANTFSESSVTPPAFAE